MWKSGNFAHVNHDLNCSPPCRISSSRLDGIVGRHNRAPSSFLGAFAPIPRRFQPGPSLQKRFPRIRNFGSARNGKIDLLLELHRQGLHVGFEEHATRVARQLDDLQATRGDFSPTVERVAQEGIVSARLTDRHFARIDSGGIGKVCAPHDVFNKFFPSPDDSVPVGNQLRRDMGESQAQSFHGS
jgi:hypothetical protein